MKAKNQTLLILLLCFAVTGQAQVSTNVINANIATASIVNKSTTDSVISNLFKSKIQLKRKNANSALTAKRASVTADNGLKTKVSKTVDCTAGKLDAILTNVELSTITDLTVKGTIDARDFLTMRDAMTVLTTIDMSAVKIVAYTGLDGPAESINDSSSVMVFLANEIPAYSFNGDSKLEKVILPNSTIAINESAFSKCSYLSSVIIPASLKKIGTEAFSDDDNLSSIIIPRSVETIEWGAFISSGLDSVLIPSSVKLIASDAFCLISGLITVDVSNPNYSSEDGVLFDKNKTMLLTCPTSKTDEYTIPSTVSFIDTIAFYGCKKLTKINMPEKLQVISFGAFAYCSELTSLTIPASVTSIGLAAFSYLKKTKKIFVYKRTPVVLPIPENLQDYSGDDEDRYVFYGIDTTKCVLYVPAGSKTAYQNANVWNAFSIIEEMSGLTLSANTASFVKAGGVIKIAVTANDTTSWKTASSDETWLTVSPAKGKGNDTLTLTATTNNTSAARTATVTVTATDLTTQTITVTQASDAVPTLTASVKALTIGTTDKSVATFKVTSNVAWTAESNQSWLTISLAVGDRDTLVTLTATANSTAASRTAKITLAGIGVTAQTITVTQAANVPVFTISSKKINIDAAANSKATFTIISNGSWRITNYNKWFTVSPVSGNGNATITISAQADTTSVDRSAMISITQSGFSTKFLTVTQTIISSTLDVSMAKHEIGLDSSVDNVLVTSNSAWVAFSDQTWLTVTPASGINNDTLILTATANNTGVSRKATVTVTVGSITKTIVITQSAYTTDIETNESLVVTIFPNPVTDILYIKNFNGKATASIYTLGGKVVLSQSLNSNYISVSELVSGIYIIRIEQTDKVSMLKFVKK